MAGPLSRLNILVVDDNAQMRTIIGTVLTGVGVGQLHYAQDGWHALQVMHHTSIDVAYVDHEMPGMSGLDFLSMVRTRETDERFLPVIMVTGHSEMSRLIEARDRGVTEFLRKPVTVGSILARLESVILRPRLFVKSASYFGPDRRRRQASDYGGPRRRASDRTVALEL